MANTILIKKSSTAAATPTVGQLSAGELAINTADGRLFAKNAAGTAVVNLPVTSISGQAITPSSVGATNNVSGSTLTSTVAVGTAPLAVTSTTVCTNLNADTVDGQHASAFATSAHTHGSVTSDGKIGSTTGQVITTGSAGVLQASATLPAANLPAPQRLSSYCSGLFFG
jgi:hypothetical protein